MAVQKIKLYVHSLVREWRSEPEISISDIDMGSCDGYTVICTREVEIDIPEFDARGLMIDSLEAQVKKERADSQVRVNLLLDRISKLKAITHEPEAL